MGSSLSCLRGERLVMSEMTSDFLCLNLCIPIPYLAMESPRLYSASRAGM